LVRGWGENRRFDRDDSSVDPQRRTRSGDEQEIVGSRVHGCGEPGLEARCASLILGVACCAGVQVVDQRIEIG
jgi:hypothetical protein